MSSRLTLAGLLCVALSWNSSLASAADRGPASDSSSSSSRSSDAPDEKLPWLAPVLSIGVTVAGTGMVLASTLPSGHIQTWQEFGVGIGALTVLLGPSAGNMYARNVGHVVMFSVGRLLLFATMFAGVSELISHDDGQTGKADGWAPMLALVGLVGIPVLSVWDGIDGHLSVKRFNDKVRSRPITLVPYVAPVPGQEHAKVAGLMLSGSF